MAEEDEDFKLILPDGMMHSAETRTEREEEREEENRSYVPVIVKRMDETVRHPDDVLESAIAEGLRQIKRPFPSLVLSSVAAGLILGFTVMAVAVISVIVLSLDNPLQRRLATAFVYPLGFVICIMSGTQLFTEHTATAVYPVLDRRAGILRLLRLWSVVILGNLMGAFLSATLLTLADDVVRAKPGYVFIVEHLLVYENFPLFISALLAGWLMAQGAWLVLATPPRISQIVSIYMVTFLIGLGGLHHSIAGSVEMFTGLLISDHFTWLEAGRFIGLALFGNLVGGALFVALLNYAHIRKLEADSKKSQENHKRSGR